MEQLTNNQAVENVTLQTLDNGGHLNNTQEPDTIADPDGVAARTESNSVRRTPRAVQDEFEWYKNRANRWAMRPMQHTVEGLAKVCKPVYEKHFLLCPSDQVEKFAENIHDFLTTTASDLGEFFISSTVYALVELAAKEVASRTRFAINMQEWRKRAAENGDQDGVTRATDMAMQTRDQLITASGLLRAVITTGVALADITVNLSWERAAQSALYIEAGGHAKKFANPDREQEQAKANSGAADAIFSDLGL